jgi:hypothetical protein
VCLCEREKGKLQIDIYFHFECKYKVKKDVQRLSLRKK